jgi:hypothetical protein
VRALLAGLGAIDAIEAGGEGAVVASFGRACYVTLGAHLLVLAASEVHPGPVHVIVDGRPPQVRRGDRVRLAPGSVLVIDGRSVDLSGVRRWAGGLPGPAAVRAGAGGIVEASAPAASRSPLLAEPYRAIALRAREALGARRLDRAARELAGLGPGLTPSGDDALAGILFALRALEGPGSEAVGSAVARSAATGPVSRAYVEWSARGQALSPAHDLLRAAAAGDEAAAGSAARQVASVGETSGADFLLGLAWGLSVLAR